MMGELFDSAPFSILFHMQFDVTILTDARFVNPPHITPYIENILLEDGLVARALEAAGLRVARVSWDNSTFDWRQTRCALFRTTWDYFERFDEFMRWVATVETQTQLINSAALARWNLDKHYLADLAARDVRVTPTRYVERGADVTLQQLFDEAADEELILKPCVSGAARHTYRLNADNLSAHEAIFRELLAVESLMVQPFQQAILDEGEVSLIVIGGEVTHGVRKIAKPGDFRVQDDHGGTVEAHAPNAEEMELAQRAVAACHPAPLYARADMARHNDGRMALMELELIEPELFFRFEPRAAEKLAQAIAAQLAPTTAAA